MKKATNIKLTPQKNADGDIESYTGFCVVHDDNLLQKRRNVSFSITIDETQKLPKTNPARKNKIAALVRSAIKKGHADWQQKEINDNVQTDALTGAELEAAIGFKELVNSDFD